jgi:hypothetical protein
MLLVEKNRLNDNYTISLVSTGIIVGEFVKVDGFYYFCKNKNRTWGLWSEEFLKSLASELELLNKEINDSIEKYFNR